jgi:hypothetical protein
MKKIWAAAQVFAFVQYEIQVIRGPWLKGLKSKETT